jgi:integrase
MVESRERDSRQSAIVPSLARRVLLVDAFTISSLLGHSNIRTTQRYVRATERSKREAVQAAILNLSGHNLATRVNAKTQNQVVA